MPVGLCNEASRGLQPRHSRFKTIKIFKRFSRGCKPRPASSFDYLIPGGGQALPDCQAEPDLVRPQGQLINRVKVPVGVSHNVVAESNCVIAKWGGEQLEAKG